MQDATPSLDDFDPETVTGWTLVRAYQVVARRFYEVLGSVGLTPMQFGVLLDLSTRPGASQADLARRNLVTPQSIGELLVSLEQRGLVHRAAARPGTAHAVTLTDDGRRALARAVPAVRDLNAPGALGLTAEQAETLNTLLHTLRRALSDPS